MGRLGTSSQTVVSSVVIRDRRTSRRLKRLGDIVFCVLALILLLPFLMLVALAIRVTSPGPILFAHPRIGLGEQTFRCLKFRTMYPDAQARLEELLLRDPAVAAEWARRNKLDRDPRITPIGRVLRATSIDELPQIWNVLRGDMSIIGPRPVTEEELLRHGNCARWYVSVHPGITGLWQISGRSRLGYAERVQLDRRYAERWSLGGDLVILLRTPLAVFLQRGAQ